MRKQLLLIVVLFSLPCSAFGAGERSRKPNVIVVLTDDQGSIDAGCYGAADLKTPAIDSLAKRGVRFSRFYAAAPVCSPSRAALLTGRYPRRCGVVENTSEKGGLPPAEATLAEMFRAAGYATALIGKWHLGHLPDRQPTAQGFDSAFGHLGGCIDNWSHFFFWSGPNRHDLQRDGREVFAPGQFFPDLMVQEATHFMTRNKERPFFLYFAINLPHYPYQPDQKWLDHYRDLQNPRRDYAAFVSTMDERLGALLKALDDLGLRDDTIIVFQSDHGHSTEERAFFGGGSAGRLRGAKFSLFEGGIRVPAIISWPGHLPQRATRNQVAHACDWLPTLAELCGTKIVNPDLDGKSLVPLLHKADAPAPHDVLHWHVFSGANTQWAVRQGDWVLIGNAQDTTNGPTKERIPLFLSDLSRDETQRQNLAKERPEVVERLQRMHDDWIARTEPATRK